MRVPRTPLAFAALLFVTACGSSTEVLAPENAPTARDLGGVGMIGSGNFVQSDTSSVEDSTEAERGGAGLMGSGN